MQRFPALRPTPTKMMRRYEILNIFHTRRAWRCVAIWWCRSCQLVRNSVYVTLHLKCCIRFGKESLYHTSSHTNDTQRVCTIHVQWTHMRTRIFMRNMHTHTHTKFTMYRKERQVERRWFVLCLDYVCIPRRCTDARHLPICLMCALLLNIMFKFKRKYDQHMRR